MASVLDFSGELLFCSSLTWRGGCRGNMFAEGLDEVLTPGESVSIFTQERTYLVQHFFHFCCLQALFKETFFERLVGRRKNGIEMA